MSPAERERQALVRVFIAHWDRTGGDLDACVELVAAAARGGVCVATWHEEQRARRAARRAVRIGQPGTTPVLRLVRMLRVEVDADAGAELLRVFAARTGVTVAQLRGPGRAKPLAALRGQLAWLLRVVPPVPLSYPSIGSLLGGRHHTTIITSVRVVERQVDADPALGDRLRVLVTVAREQERAA
jgi:hypothetical protein